MRTLVSLDIETTGLDAERDAIIEIGLVKFRGDEVLDEWSSIINPRRPIPYKITELTGIDNAMALKGIDLWPALQQTSRICGNATIIGHNISFDLGFLRKQRQLERNPALDTFELASILVPHAGRYSLGALAAELGITLPATHRALDDARVAHQLYLKVFDRAMDLPQEIVNEIAGMADRSGWTLADFWRDVREARERGTFNTSIGAALKGRRTTDGRRRVANVSSVVRRQEQLDAKPLKAKEHPEPLNVETVAKTLGPDGPFAKQFENYEARPQQIQMLRKVTETFNEGGVVFIEAGTGTGKSLAYLIPAMMWAIQNGERVVISTNTINLQEQLADKDVPAVIDILAASGAGAGRAAVMKGKGRYLCQLRLKDLQRIGPKSLDEARVLTKILIWLPNTLTGDADELFIPSPGERAVFQHLSAQNPACNMNTCSATDCYFYQARRVAESSHVVIVNHALLLADIAVENRALPEYKRLVIDEGHHLESAATESLTYRIDRDEVGRVLGDLGRSTATTGERGRRASGLLSEIASRARQSLSVEKSGAVEVVTNQATEAAANVYSLSTSFFDLLMDFFADEVSEMGEYSQRVRLTKAVRNRTGWGQVELAGDNFCKAFNALTKHLDTLFKGLGELSEVIADADLLQGRLNGAIRFCTEASEQLSKMITKPHDESIYWAEIENRRFSGRSSGPKLSLNVAPLRVGPLMEKFIWHAKDSVVLTSATMRTANSNAREASFDYVKDRLSAHAADTLAVGSPFDYKASTLVYLVSDIPEPNQQGYQQWVEKGLIELFRASQGRGLALFTSNASLRATGRSIAPELIKDDIIVYEQGDGTSRRVMLEQFKSADKAVLLGTRSFWEGVDIQGDKLSALAILKLPFDVPTDPIFSARSETFSNSFSDYSVPETVLKFRQGFGRLIRSKTDRGVVAIFDRRLISKNYGAAFLAALPGPTVVRGPLAGLAKATTDWLNAKPRSA
jgi:DNA polymerase-3 subunit epsilon/ATP-dependent DNA helicase DinG